MSLEKLCIGRYIKVRAVAEKANIFVRDCTLNSRPTDSKRILCPDN